MLSIIGYRGEQSGNLFTRFDLAKTNANVGFFFATEDNHAARYAGFGTSVRSFELKLGRCLNLENPYGAGIKPFLDDFWGEYDDWVDRSSGEVLNRFDLNTMLEVGMLYNYEGTGSGQRWNHLFRLARNQGYDSVRVLDATDGSAGQPVPILVLFDSNRISFH